MPINQRGIAHLAFIILVVVGIALGLYLVQTRTNISPNAQQVSIAPQTAFHLFLSHKTRPVPGLRGSNGQESSPSAEIIKSGGSVMPGDSVAVNLSVSSDIDYSNVFNANIQFPQDLLEVQSIYVTSDKSASDSEPEASGSSSINGPTDARDVDDGEGGVSSGGSNNGGGMDDEDGEVCAQVITRACKPRNDRNCKVLEMYPPQLVCNKESDKQCKDFPTPCDVPDGWYVEGPVKPPPSSDCSTLKCKPGFTCQPGICTRDFPPSYCEPAVCVPIGSPGKVKNYFIKFWIAKTIKDSTTIPPIARGLLFGSSTTR